MPTELQEFTEIFERLEVVYGVKDEKTIKVYWDRLKNFDSWIIKKAVNKALDEGPIEYFPKLSFLVQTASWLRDQEYKKHKKPTYCSKCECSGLLIIKSKEDGIVRSFTYRCDCSNGDRQSKQIPSIRDLDRKVNLADSPSSESLPSAEYREIVGHPEKMFKGILIKPCKKCGNNYYVRYEKPIRIRELMETQENSLGLCDPCYIEEGRKRGFWE